MALGLILKKLLKSSFPKRCKGSSLRPIQKKNLLRLNAIEIIVSSELASISFRKMYISITITLVFLDLKKSSERLNNLMG